MNTIKLIAVIFSCVFAISCASNPSKNNTGVSPYSAQGWGGTSCQQLIDDITPKKVGFEQAVDNVKAYQAWVSGFISGVNYSSTDTYDVSGETEPEESFIWIKEYCNQHLEITVPQALHTLLDSWEKEGKIIRTPRQ